MRISTHEPSCLRIGLQDGEDFFQHIGDGQKAREIQRLRWLGREKKIMEKKNADDSIPQLRKWGRELDDLDDGLIPQSISGAEEKFMSSKVVGNHV